MRHVFWGGQVTGLLPTRDEGGFGLDPVAYRRRRRAMAPAVTASKVSELGSGATMYSM